MQSGPGRPRSIVERWVSKRKADVWLKRGWEAVQQKGQNILVSKKLPKWQKFEMDVRDFLKGIFLEDTIEVDDFGFTDYGDYQLDACGGLAGHFILIDCTSSEEARVRSLRDKIKDFQNKQPDFERDIRKRLGQKYQHIHYAICTQGIEVLDEDIAYAKDRGIRIIPSENLSEWMKLRTIGSATLAFQFVEYFSGDKVAMAAGKPFRFPAIKLPYSADSDGRVLFAFVASPEELLRLGFVYRLEYKDVMGYQRPLKLPKLRDINRYLAEDPHNGFPNSLLVAFDEAQDRRLEFEPIPGVDPDARGAQLGTLIVPAFFGIAEIIDGQHRLFGYHDFGKTTRYSVSLANRRLSDRLLVVAYPDPQKTARPKLFLDINSNQTRIPTQQIWAMMRKSRPDTQMGYIGNVVAALNSNGPLRGKVRIPGETRGTKPLNIANIGKGIEDRHLFDDGTGFDWNLYTGVRGKGKYPTEAEVPSVKALNALFQGIRDSALGDWTSGGRSFLVSNNGANVMLRVYVEILKFYRQSSRTVTVSSAMVRSLLSPALRNYLADSTAGDLLKRTSTEAGREAVAAELMIRIRRRHPGFAARYLVSRSKRKQE